MQSDQPKDRGRFQIDESVAEDKREEIFDKMKKNLETMKSELAERRPILEKRQDFFEGRHHKWTNVVGQVVKQQEGHILAVFNLINRMCTKIHQTLTNHPPRIKVSPRDEANEIEVSRAQAVEQALNQILKDNKFWGVTYKRCGINQIRDGDFIFECKVMEQAGQKKIMITPNEDLSKIIVGWDDAAGSSFSFIVFEDMMSTAKILREYGYEADNFSDNSVKQEGGGDHNKDQYGMFATSGGASVTVPSGQAAVPKARVRDYWGYEVINNQVRVVNIIQINDEMVQFINTDYKRIPKFIGHSMVVAGKPWSMSFIDNLIDPQIELNDRSSEEGDLIRIGSHMKFLAINMTDFDPDSVKPGSGQVIFIEGEGADFRPLQMNITPFPSDSYLNRVQEYMYTLGIPKIALASGTAPYTGKVGAIQYQPFSDLIEDFRIQWEIPMTDMLKTIQEYLIAYFPETAVFMKESIQSDDGMSYTDGEMIVREIEYDWENPLPLSRSDKVVDASTLRDRGAVSLSTYLEQAGFSDPEKEIKKLKKEAKDQDLMTLVKQFQQYAPGVVEAQLDAQKKQAEAAEQNADLMGQMNEAKNPGTPATPAPILQQSQNDGRRGVLTGTGSPSGQTATPEGAVRQTTQNLNAQSGV